MEIGLLLALHQLKGKFNVDNDNVAANDSSYNTNTQQSSEDDKSISISASRSDEKYFTLLNSTTLHGCSTSFDVI